MNKKTFHAPLELKAGDAGEFEAVFATLDVVDFDQDLTRPGAFPTGRDVVIEPWNHDRGLPVGKGVIVEKDGKALIDGSFFLHTATGREHYETVKALGPLTEWSYTFWIVESGQEEIDGQQVRTLEKLDVVGVGPVTRGAGLGTQTVAIKAAGEDDAEIGAAGKDAGEEDTTGEDEGQGGPGHGDVEPSGPPPGVVRTGIEIELLEV